MRIKKIILIVFISLLALSTIQAKSKNTQVYVYGFAESFNDSTVYFTDIQVVTPAHISKGGFLYGRDSYSYQLKQYLETKGIFHLTCVTFFATSRKAIERKFSLVKKRYTKENSYNIKYITTTDFSYTSVIPDSQAPKNESVEETKKE